MMNRAQRRAAEKAAKRPPAPPGRPIHAPTLIAMQITPEVGIAQRMALEGLRAGWADKAQFNALGECCNLLSHGAVLRQDREADQVADLGSAALANIMDRYRKTKRIGASGDEIRALEAMVDFAEDWWNRQGGTTFHAAYEAMQEESATAERAAA